MRELAVAVGAVVLPLAHELGAVGKRHSPEPVPRCVRPLAYVCRSSIYPTVQLPLWQTLGDSRSRKEGRKEGIPDQGGGE